MITKKIITAVLAITITGTGLGGFTIARGDDNKAAERAALESASISLQKAIEVAETEVGGKAIESGVENENGGTIFYKVKVLAKDGAEKKVLIDMKTGNVAKVMDDDQDDDDDDDDKD